VINVSKRKLQSLYTITIISDIEQMSFQPASKNRQQCVLLVSKIWKF